MCPRGLFIWQLFAGWSIYGSTGQLSLDWAVGARPCTPSEALRALDCFRWVQPNTPVHAIWQVCEYPSPRSLKRLNISAAERSATANLCCRCFAKFALAERQLAQEHAKYRNQLMLQKDALLNLSSRFSPPLIFRSPATYDEMRTASQRFNAVFGRLVQDSWRKSVSLLALVDDTAAYDSRSLERLVASTLIRARINAEGLRELLLQAQNRCLPNIFSQSCTTDHLPVFHSFLPVEGPEPEGHEVDFLGRSSSRVFSCRR